MNYSYCSTKLLQHKAASDWLVSPTIVVGNIILKQIAEKGFAHPYLLTIYLFINFVSLSYTSSIYRKVLSTYLSVSASSHFWFYLTDLSGQPRPTSHLTIEAQVDH